MSGGDHLAGSVAAMELLEHLVQVCKGTDREKFFVAIRSEVATEGVPQLRHLDHPRLERRAREQFERVEAQRLQAARAAFGT